MPAPEPEELYRAASEVNVDKVKSLLAAKAHPNDQSSFYSTPLIAAVSSKEGTAAQREEIVKVLIDANADVKPRDRLGQTALSYAARRNNTKMARMLIAANADVNTIHKRGATPLLYALHAGRESKDTRLARMLIKAGANVNAIEEFNKAFPQVAGGVRNSTETRQDAGTELPKSCAVKRERDKKDVVPSAELGAVHTQALGRETRLVMPAPRSQGLYDAAVRADVHRTGCLEFKESALPYTARRGNTEKSPNAGSRYTRYRCIK